MDIIEGLAKQASQITMYDVKSYYNQAKNYALNVTEMEAKVREATNDDPWGASSTLMQQISDGTHNFAQFNEVMPTIYARFMEKEAREWRQIYKALTLLEFLVKNGSERVVDDARAHVSTIKMLRSFHYIDEKGKDQGINVRNRAQEIASLLGDVEKIRQERKKAKSNKSKYQGQGNDGGMSFVTTSGSRYGGFGSDSVEGGGGGGGGGSNYDTGDNYRSSSRNFRDSSARQDHEYDEYEGADNFADERAPRRSASASTSRPSSKPQPPPKKPTVTKQEKPAEKPKEVNLFDFDDEPAPAAPAKAPAPIFGGDDDFDDFQEAPSSPLPPAVTSTSNANKNGNLFDLLNTSVSAPSMTAQQPRALPLSTSQLPSPARHTSFAQPQQATYGMMSPPLSQPQQPFMASRPSYTSTPSTANVASSQPALGSAFDDLWSTSLSSVGGKGIAQNITGTKSINEMGKEKAMSSLWGPSQPSPGMTGGAGQPQYGHSQVLGNTTTAGAGDDLLL